MAPCLTLFSIAFDYNAKPDKFYFEAEVTGGIQEGKLFFYL
jgi:hypothetical protein